MRFLIITMFWIFNLANIVYISIKYPKRCDNPSLFSYKILASLFLLQKSSKSYIAKECTHNKSLKNSGNAVVAVYISVRTGYVNKGMLDRVQLNHVMAVY